MLYVKPIRVMQITHDLAIGGLQQVVVNICRNINRDRFSVSVLCLRAGGELVSELEEIGIPVLMLPQKRYGTDYFSFLKVASILRREKTEVIHTHNKQPFIDGTLGGIIARSRTIVHTDHGRIFPDKRRYAFAEWVMSHFVYRIASVSNKTREDLIRYEKIRRKKIITVPNGVDERLFETCTDPEAKKRELGISGRYPILGIGARLVKEKGIDYLLGAVSELRKHYPGILLIIAGTGPYEDTLKNGASELEITDHVAFVGARMDMPELLSVFDVYVLPSLSEGMPLALLEAMAAGCPIVATNVGGVPDIITDGYNGTLVEPRDSYALAKAILDIMRDDEQRERFRERSRFLYEQHYSATAMTKIYESLYLRGNP
ncbi:MAG: glycosyltransferase [Syntrophales bacterium]|jgi:glycosyltransferase involved in cell wall biosynthesis|nr:glycosyltransferase [Syntrophales bacterium]